LGKLDGRVAFITGGGQGIGNGIALALAKDGAGICIAELDPQRGKAAAEELAALGVPAIAVSTDASRREQIEEAVAITVSDLGRLDILVNNATGAGPDSFRPLLEQTSEQWDRQLAVDVKGSFHCLQACFPHLRDSGVGRVISICSEAGSERAWGFAAYSAAKEALRALTGVVAREWGEHGITANVICPTAITPATAGYLEANPEEARASLASKAMKRHGEPETDIGGVAVFLASDAAGYMTGQTLWVDGGHVIHS
jgi:NAD(P)-dependent dehydrogenase (short-subunit alcohol dehydrogenase family)